MWLYGNKMAAKTENREDLEDLQRTTTFIVNDFLDELFGP